MVLWFSGQCWERLVATVVVWRSCGLLYSAHFYVTPPDGLLGANLNEWWYIQSFQCVWILAAWCEQNQRIKNRFRREKFLIKKRTFRYPLTIFFEAYPRGNFCGISCQITKIIIV